MEIQLLKTLISCVKIMFKQLSKSNTISTVGYNYYGTTEEKSA